MFSATVITVSDSSYRGERPDLSGPAVVEVLEANQFRPIRHIVLPDEQIVIQDALRREAAEVRLIVTTGGTGISPRDVTPEATLAVCDRVLDGFAELMRLEGRKQSSFAPLSRAVTGTRGTTLIVNLPGSPGGAVLSLQTVLGLIPHALHLLDGTAVQHHYPGSGNR